VCEQAAAAVAAGIDVIQLREPALSAAELLTLATSIVDIAKGSATQLVVNDRYDVARASGAHGVHLRSRSPLPRDIRVDAPAGFLIGRSIHTVADVAASDGADYLIAGTVWPTTSKPAAHATIGLTGLRDIARATAIPVLAIGGVTVDRAPLVLEQGAAGLAAIALFAESDELAAFSGGGLARTVKTLRRIG
jgi:thiamine-phosphate pyrophosphorylase